MNKIRIDVDWLEDEAISYFENMTPQEEIRKNNVTDKFKETWENRIANKELGRMRINGTVASGKSTFGFKMNALTFKYIRKYHDSTKEMEIRHICADQTEFIRRSKKDGVYNESFVIDEDNPMAYVGLNATTDEAYMRHIIELQAQRYIHRITCAPESTVDETADIIVQVKSKNVEKKTLQALVFYRISQPNLVVPQLVGHMELYVGDVVCLDKEPYDKLNKYQKLYRLYRKIKFDRLNLLNKHSIDGLREIRRAAIVLGVVEQLSSLTKNIKVSRDMVANEVDRVRREKGEVISFISKEEMIRSATSILGLQADIYRLNNKYIKTGIESINEDVKKLIQTRNAQMEDLKFKSNMEQAIEEINNQKIEVNHP